MSSGRLRLYEAFRAVMMTGSITGAAKLLRRTQPAITRTIAELEQKSGVLLFERKGRRLQPTAEADQLLPVVEETLKRLYDLDRHVETLAAPAPDRLTIAVVPAYSTECAASLISHLRALHPELRITLLVRDASVVPDLVHKGIADIGIGGIANGDPQDMSIVGSFDLVCAVPATHPLAERKEISGKDLDGMDFIAFDHELSPLHLTRQIVEHAGGKPNVVVETQRTHAAYALVAAKVGASLIEPMTALSFSSKQVAIRRFTPSVSHSIYLLYNPKSTRSALLRSVEKLVKQSIADARHRIEERLDI
ncbi:MAG: LysR family transcriptional regulator [Pseudomonadota bacterium]